MWPLDSTPHRYLLGHKRPDAYPEHEILLQLGWTFEKLAEASEAAQATLAARGRGRRDAPDHLLVKHAAESPAALRKDSDQAYETAFQSLKAAAVVWAASTPRTARSTTGRTPRSARSTTSAKASPRTAAGQEMRRAKKYKSWQAWRNDPKAWLHRRLRYASNGDDMFAVRNTPATLVWCRAYMV